MFFVCRLKLPWECTSDSNYGTAAVIRFPEGGQVFWINALSKLKN